MFPSAIGASFLFPQATPNKKRSSPPLWAAVVAVAAPTLATGSPTFSLSVGSPSPSAMIGLPQSTSTTPLVTEVASNTFTTGSPAASISSGTPAVVVDTEALFKTMKESPEKFFEKRYYEYESQYAWLYSEFLQRVQQNSLNVSRDEELEIGLNGLSEDVKNLAEYARSNDLRVKEQFKDLFTNGSVVQEQYWDLFDKSADPKEPAPLEPAPFPKLSLIGNQEPFSVPVQVSWEEFYKAWIQAQHACFQEEADNTSLSSLRIEQQRS